MAQGLFDRRVRLAGLADRVRSDSAGTHASHAGVAPDARAQSTLRALGVEIGHLRGRAVRSSDYHEFDYLLAMDLGNRAHLGAAAPAEHAAKVRLLLEFRPVAGVREVPDPYHGDERGFVEAAALIEEAVEGLVDVLRERLDAAA
jgi:protein-tyrosine phosphatase